MIVRPELQCESPYFHGLWYFYLKEFLDKIQIPKPRDLESEVVLFETNIKTTGAGNPVVATMVVCWTFVEFILFIHPTTVNCFALLLRKIPKVPSELNIHL